MTGFRAGDRIVTVDTPGRWKDPDRYANAPGVVISVSGRVIHAVMDDPTLHDKDFNTACMFWAEDITHNDSYIIEEEL